MSDDPEKARLEAIVFGRDDSVTDAERDAAAAELERLLEEERARDAAAHAAEREAMEAPEPSAIQRQEDSRDWPSEEPPRAGPRWRRPLVLGAITIAVVIVAGVMAPALVSGRPLFGPSDSMAIFDRPQTERDLEYPTDIYLDVIADSARFVGSAQGFDVFVFQASDPEGRSAQDPIFCMVVGDGGATIGMDCGTQEEFALGTHARSTHTGRWVETSWDIHNGVTVTTGTFPPTPPPLAVFDQEQDDADLNALAYLPDIPPSQQETARFLGESAGYSVAAYRDADDLVCLAVYQGSTVVATSESVCVTEHEFEDVGIQVIYPAAEPEISVTWSSTGLAFGGR